MNSLEEVRKKNFILGWLGINFTTPLFRKLTGQFPFDVKTFTIYGESEKQRNKKFKRILKNNKEGFLLILRDENAELEEVLFVPSLEIFDQIQNEQSIQA